MYIVYHNIGRTHIAASMRWTWFAYWAAWSIGLIFAFINGLTAFTGMALYDGGFSGEASTLGSGWVCFA